MVAADLPQNGRLISERIATMAKILMVANPDYGRELAAGNPNPPVLIPVSLSRHTLIDRGFTMAELHHVVHAGFAIVHGAAVLTLSSDGEFYVMQGDSGRHSLSVSATDYARLSIHWQGFKLRNQ